MAVSETAVAAILDGSYRTEAAAPAPRYDAIMTDIETLALHPGQAFLLSQGVVPFSLTLAGPIMGPPLLLVFDPYEQLFSERIIDPKTRKFWRTQPPAASAHFRDPDYVGHGGVKPTRCAVGDIAGHMSALIENHCVRQPEVYSQGIVFDLGNLTSAMADSDQVVPWQYWAATDCRTLRRKLPKLREGPQLTPADGAAHDPIFDSVKQIWALWEVATPAMLGLENLPTTTLSAPGTPLLETVA
ncbi:MAG: hypothetical protein JWP92_3703 [Caulobacter sp.]|nr:hypothetical protein [Caulobacter sp.]